MATFVLVHGAWHGGWCYRETAKALRDAGHTVFTPTHTGVGERSHQAAENITLETHIRDVCGCIEWAPDNPQSKRVLSGTLLIAGPEADLEGLDCGDADENATAQAHHRGARDEGVAEL